MNRFNLAICLALLLMTSCKKKEVTPMPTQYSQIMCAPLTTDMAWYQSDTPAPLIDGLDVLNFPIATKNQLAQRYFN